METGNQSANGAASPQPADPAPASDADLTGQVLAGFRLMHLLGQGGMGQVYLAEQLSLKRKVALKLLHPEMATNERSLKRFKAEAENVARAIHANIVQIYDISQVNGLHYIALEYVEGKNLREFIEKKGTPELSLGLHIMAQAAAALQRAGELGVIHRDVKPENIMLTKKGEVKVADFGLSRCFEEGHTQNITQSQVVMGTPLYMSPEQVERKTIDSRTDIYSLGVTCYFMFAGQPPFRGNSPVDVAYQHVHAEPPPLCELRPDLPIDLCTMIHKMMAKKPEERYQSAREIVREISRLRESLNLGAIAAISMSASFVAAGADVPREPGSKTWPIEVPRPARWRRFVLVGCVLIALAAGMSLGLYQHQRAVSPKDPAPPDDQFPIKAIFEEKVREDQLKTLVMERLDKESRLGLELAIELSVGYLEQKKFDAASELFKELTKKGDNLSYRKLGRIGHAMVLAFTDNPKESNEKFVEILAEFKKFEDRVGPGNFFKSGPITKKLVGLEDEIEKYKLLWKANPPMRELVAKALHYNRTNAPDDFSADELATYLVPPRPVLK